MTRSDQLMVLALWKKSEVIAGATTSTTRTTTTAAQTRKTVAASWLCRRSAAVAVSPIPVTAATRTTPNAAGYIQKLAGLLSSVVAAAASPMPAVMKLSEQ